MIIFIFMMCDIFSIIILTIYLAFLSIALVITISFGEGNLDRVKMTGPFEVGYQDIYSEKDGRAVSVWYPMDKEDYVE